MHCDDVKKHLWAFLMEETSPQINEKIKIHLQGCPSCQSEREALQKIQGAMLMDVSSSMPEDFTETLHQKLAAAAEEMATPSLRERWKEGFEQFRRYGAWKTVAPALVCLVLVIGVFSTGLYDKWQNHNPILTEPVLEEPVIPTVTESPNPDSTPEISKEAPPSSGVVSSKPPIAKPVPSAIPPARNTDVSVDIATQNDIPPQPQPPVETADIPAPAVAVAEAGETPAPASIGLEDESTAVGTYQIQRQVQELYQVTVPEVIPFLDGWREDWQEYQPDTDPQELCPGVAEDSVLLQLNQPIMNDFKNYAQEVGVTTDSLPEPLQEETLVLVTGNEE